MILTFSLTFLSGEEAREEAEEADPGEGDLAELEPSLAAGLPLRDLETDLATEEERLTERETLLDLDLMLEDRDLLELTEEADLDRDREDLEELERDLEPRLPVGEGDLEESDRVMMKSIQTTASEMS